MPPARGHSILTPCAVYWNRVSYRQTGYFPLVVSNEGGVDREAASSIPPRGSGRLGSADDGTPGLMIPAFSPAIFSMVLPRSLLVIEVNV